MGRGLGVHKALDQIGAFAGPLLVAGLIALSGAICAGAARPRRPRGGRHGAAGDHPAPAARAGRRPGAGGRRRRRAAAAAAVVPAGSPSATTLCTAGLVTFGLISFHLVERHLVPTAGAPLLYAAAMAAGALAALATGEVYDRLGPRVLLGLPRARRRAFRRWRSGARWRPPCSGCCCGAPRSGVQDSTVKALVADLVPRERRATAYGVFAAMQGAGALVGGIAAGALYSALGARGW